MKNRMTIAGGALVLLALLCVGALAQPGAESDRESARLRRKVKDAAQDVDAIRSRLPLLQSDVAKLEEKLKGIEPTKLKAEEVEELDRNPAERARPTRPGGPMAQPAKKEDERATWRLPIAKESDRKTKLFVVCRYQKLYYFDLQALFDAIDKDDGRTADRNGTYFLQSGDYDAKFYPGYLEAVLRSGRTGETAEHALGPDSNLLKRFAKLPPDENIIQFSVYPDSYDLFRAIRKATYEREYEVAWNPKSADQPIRLVSGKATGQ